LYSEGGETGRRKRSSLTVFIDFGDPSQHPRHHGRNLQPGVDLLLRRAEGGGGSGTLAEEKAEEEELAHRF
jgi:hypothetical protein